MNPTFRKDMEDYFARRQPDMLRDLKELIAIPSTRGESQDGMPYGVAPAMVLAKAIELMEREGLFTKNYDNYACTGDLTDLEAGLDILAHLDVVPAENNWTVCPPYEPKLVGDRLYGRGAIDDKGPAIAALYAMACVKEMGLPLKRNVRLILGTDEECGSSDLEHYFSLEQEAPMTFTPDASFPLINVEKGRLCGELHGSFSPDKQLPYIAAADCGLKTNVIPEKASASIVGMTGEQLQPYLDAAAEKTGVSFQMEEQQGSVTVLCQGVSGHAAYPETANNALTALLQLLASLPCADSEGFRKLQALQALFPHGDYRGAALGIAMEDEISGYLTCSADLLRLDDTSLYLCFDSRCPVCATDENTRLAACKRAEAAGLAMGETKMVLPHHVSADSEFVQTLLRAYEDWSGKPGVAQATGGGTYVHDLQRGVAFGCETEGIDNHLHGADEFITLEQLMMSAKIFAQAIIALCC